jgi:hypothetical protein
VARLSEISPFGQLFEGSKKKKNVKLWAMFLNERFFI